MPKPLVDGTPGIANDGTPVVYVASEKAFLPIPAAKALLGKTFPNAVAGKAVPLGKDWSDKLKDVQAQYKTAHEASEAANDFAIRNESTPTGGLLGIPLGIGPSLGQSLGYRGSENYPAMQRDQLSMVAANKPASMQRLAGPEISLLKGTGPSLGNQGPANAPMQKYYNNQDILNSAQQSFYSNAQRQGMTVSQADDAWNQYQRQRFDPQGNWRAQANAALQAKSAAARGTAPPPVVTPPAPAGITPSLAGFQ
jgi:hypothetical protein